MFTDLLIDLDDTILDFKKAERIALEKTLETVGIVPTPEVCQRYSEINQMHWQMLERGEMTRDQILTGRFEMLFRELQWDADVLRTSDLYIHNLATGHYFLPGAVEVLPELCQKYRLYLASNGTAWVQNSRLDSANIRHFFRDIFISQDIGVNKPDRAYFEGCFRRIPGINLAETMIVGDSLTSDILGGKNAGIATCWVNPKGKQAPAHLQPDYQIPSLAQLPDLLDSLT